MLLSKTHPRFDEALAIWADIAPRYGIVPDNYKPELIWHRDEPMRSHVVIRLTGPNRLILKKIFVPPANVDLAKVVSAHRNASERLELHDKAHAPEIIYASPNGDCILMREAAGKTLKRHLAAGQPHAPLLRRSGEWLAAFHGASVPQTRIYQPMLSTKRVGRVAAAVTDGQRKVMQPALFLACWRQIPDIAKAFGGRETLFAGRHGDFNPVNLILGENEVTGLDFEPESCGPVGYDIASLLTEYAILFQDKKSLAPGQVLSDETLDAFFEGYDLADRNDPAVCFLPFVRLLNLWRLVPVRPWYSKLQRRAWTKGIKFLAQNAFHLT